VSPSRGEVSSARKLVSGRVRRRVGHSCPRSSEKDYTCSATETLGQGG